MPQNLEAEMSVLGVSFLNKNGISTSEASTYRNPAKVIGGTSSSPILMNIHEVDQIIVTSIAKRMAFNLEGFFICFLLARTLQKPSCL